MKFLHGSDTVRKNVQGLVCVLSSKIGNFILAIGCAVSHTKQLARSGPGNLFWTRATSVL